MEQPIHQRPGDQAPEEYGPQEAAGHRAEAAAEEEQPQESLGAKCLRWARAVRSWFMEVPGHNIAVALIVGGFLFKVARVNQWISFHDALQFFSANGKGLRSGRLCGFMLAPFNHAGWDSFAFSSIGLFLTGK